MPAWTTCSTCLFIPALSPVPILATEGCPWLPSQSELISDIAAIDDDVGVLVVATWSAPRRCRFAVRRHSPASHSMSRVASTKLMRRDTFQSRRLALGDSSASRSVTPPSDTERPALPYTISLSMTHAGRHLPAGDVFSVPSSPVCFPSVRDTLHSCCPLKIKLIVERGWRAAHSHIPARVSPTQCPATPVRS